MLCLGVIRCIQALVYYTGFFVYYFAVILYESFLKCNQTPEESASGMGVAFFGWWLKDTAHHGRQGPAAGGFSLLSLTWEAEEEDCLLFSSLPSFYSVLDSIGRCRSHPGQTFSCWFIFPGQVLNHSQGLLFSLGASYSGQI